MNPIYRKDIQDRFDVEKNILDELSYARKGEYEWFYRPILVRNEKVKTFSGFGFKLNKSGSNIVESQTLLRGEIISLWSLSNLWLSKVNQNLISVIVKKNYKYFSQFKKNENSKHLFEEVDCELVLQKEHVRMRLYNSCSNYLLRDIVFCKDGTKALKVNL